MEVISFSRAHQEQMKGLYFILEEFLAIGEDMHSFEIRTEKAMAPHFSTLAWSGVPLPSPAKIQI